MLDFRMETFLTVCQCMNYTRASETLHITQPAVSQHIRFLEKHYKAKLFRYEGKRLVLTPAGEILRLAAAAQKQDELSLQNQILKIEKPVKDIRFGATAAVGEAFMGKVLQSYFQKDTDIRLSMKTGTTKELLRLLESGELDFVLTDGFFDGEEYEAAVYTTERLIAVSAPDWKPVSVPERKSAVKRECLDSLFPERLLLPEKEDGAREALERFLAVSGRGLADFKRRAEIGSLQTIKNLVKTGCGIAFLYEACVREELQEGTLKEIKIKNFNLNHDFTFLWRKSSIYGELYRGIFKEFCREI